MDYRGYMFSGVNRQDPPQEFDASFSEILKRTRQNINRINQRYSTPGSENTAPKLQS